MIKEYNFAAFYTGRIYQEIITMNFVPPPEKLKKEILWASAIL